MTASSDGFVDDVKEAAHRENVARIAAQTCTHYAMFFASLGLLAAYVTAKSTSAGVAWAPTITIFSFAVWL